MVSRAKKTEKERPLTVEGLAIASLSLGLSFQDFLSLPVGFLLGMLNEKQNQLMKADKKDEAKQGNANMLMGM